MRGGLALRAGASRNVQVLRRIMRRFAPVIFSSVFWGQIDSGCSCKIRIGDLQVMALGDQLGVAEPTTDNVLGVFVRQFRLPSRPQVVT